MEQENSGRQPFTCPICGGKQKIRIDAGTAVCESCGRIDHADPKDLERIREICKSAERAVRQNSAAGYEDAIRSLRAIEDVADVRERIAEYEKRRGAILSEQQAKQEKSRASDRRDTRIGVILAIVSLLLCAAALGGIVYLAVQFIKGTLSKGAVTVILSVVAAAVAVSVFGRVFASRNGGSES